ncbi:MAG: hypothetical protein A2312_01855 [Candidatus Staskawiczbacteria bacterium RIFOXYB2_FULL_32_9]|uniref:Uncharacterized protein n=1 Tax=Candidatus Staskawiczbacteria bacterium RIFOXYD1_FULL_32_13 TaxID=1802234 RepID=A0A1G2JN57_9BACT|nr:MAG: hypothetical protein UR22_C0001G0097 [Parcubacteria group bacterium GW2011_GWC2_32_10]OGZ77335.1 MAG: hypothetical protein A2256_03755 [Candidatus Staskawiczbacteria bacterium RIFOXYA2_FULL_32_7]OGZ77815.1 MAG: hypothetical protein A2360_04425 [Candidatus Staskawiczbacteria bacterium RIFOXYB1_FULL_32_11]OGZ82114.1 MAG: hypothetical protein A2312_01855 [Candidatus Staskawiczbacteria bacterium RIFOXYB2_FULL_32_9]OGZ87278.1 MAG: hypothetical protein A2463_02865 [Candidatus Staskawiczbacter
MQSETKTHSTSSVQACQNCKNDFTIEPDDFVFYEKMKVPAPTFCPECRIIRRMTWRNERTLYHRKCDATGKNIITMFAPEQPVVVYERDYWWSDSWDQLASGQDYDFSKPFFQQFRELFEKAPLSNLANTNIVNSDYSNHSLNLKNCYLFYAGMRCEDMLYSTGAMDCKNSIDLYNVGNLIQCYDDTLCGDLNRVSFSYDSDESVNCAFLHACKNMMDSLGCINLRNKSNCIFNQQYTKEEYAKERAKYDFGSYKNLEGFKKKFVEFKKQYPRRHGFIHKCANTIGDNIINCKNIYMGFDIFGDAQDSKYVIHGAEFNNIYDGYGIGATHSNSYEIVDTGDNATLNRFAVFTHSCLDTHYTYACKNSQNLFGCVGLRSKRYCILNKQYTKEEYETLVPKIINHMNEMPYIDAKGRVYKYGEFFPTELSPFAYNETIAQEYYSKTKEDVLESGFRWREPETKNYNITLKPQDLPDHIKDVTDDILNQVIACEHEGKCNHQCMGAFKIIASELAFYRAMNLALPRLCSNCRHYARLAQRTPFKLWDRNCAKCGKEIKTSYAPERLEIIYCESCYNNEVA